jgi:ribosomal protein L40E
MKESDQRARADDIERTLAGKVSWGLPAATVAGAIGVGILFGVGPAILVLAAGALVGVIALLWASLRTLGGDAPLAEGLVAAAAMREKVSDTAERKQRVLRALKDLELEHSVGKIDDEDFAEMSARYREQAKGILREMDVQIEPLRPKAEALVRAHLAKRGPVNGTPEEKGSAAPALEADEGRAPAAARQRVACGRCETSNEPDAEFCKKCRARLSRIACPSCATSNEPDATFCKKCGASLGSEPLAEAKNA